jgi:hypothetical protein
MTLTNDKPDISSERALCMDTIETFKQDETSGHEPWWGVDTKANRLTGRQTQCDFDL